MSASSRYFFLYVRIFLENKLKVRERTGLRFENQLEKNPRLTLF